MTGLLTGIVLAGPTGCSLFVSSTESVAIEASDPNARIFVDGRDVGVGKATVPLKRNDTYTVRAEGADGQVATGRIRKQISTTGILDLIGGFIFLVPFIGAAAPGFWDLEPDYLFLKVGPAAQSTRPAR